MRAVHPTIAAADPRVIRPRDLRDVYANPSKELGDLADQGAVLRLAHGYYAVVPEEVRHLGGWTPTAEGAALGIAQRDYGIDRVALMGMSAARIAGAVPRALGAAVVAVPKQRPPVDTAVGRVTFVKRDVTTLGLRRADTDLAEGWVTDAEQTLLDLEDRPRLAGFPAEAVREAKRALLVSAEADRLALLAGAQRKRSAQERVLAKLQATR